MLLSIVMMVKNEEKYLENTLKSLKPLMEDINSELIILDTGSTDKSVNIAKQYTDKIYFKKWNDNFADMRNASISYAKGDWILILDADEQLINYEKLIKFLNSNLYNKYNSASIELQNIHSEYESSYAKVSILRLFKKNKEFRYEGAIHEQPIYKRPIYNNIATFKHYGYMYTNEEIKQKKIKRNEKILFKELENKPNDPYIHYQLGKNYFAYENYEDALFYMEEAHNLYKGLGMKPIYVQLNLAKLYLELLKYSKCEKICLEYIKNDDKNIDMYYYLALAQKSLGKIEDSLLSYQRYLFLVENYDISTQANSIYCDGNTEIFKDNVQVDIIKNYYQLEKYSEIINNIEIMELKIIKKVYFIIFMSLYKLNRVENILNLYNNLSSTVEKKGFKYNLEKIILIIRESDKTKVYKLLSNIEENYGLLNEIRLGKELTAKQYNKILNKEKEAYYGEIIYYAYKQKIDLINILKGISNVHMQNYIDYIIINRRDCILDLYRYVLNTSNTLDINKLNIYSCLCKSLLLYGKFIDEKYEMIFLMYITYRYECIKKMYKENLLDNEIVNFVDNSEDMFIVNINMIQKLKNNDNLQYIRNMKSILVDNSRHKKGIQMLINKFEDELKESKELKKLRIKYNSIIEKSINSGAIDDAVTMINEYEGIFKNDKLYNMKAIINIYKGNIEESEKLLKFSYLNNKYDENTLFNIAYIKELKKEYKEALSFYNEALKLSLDKELNIEILNRINNIKYIQENLKIE